MKLTRYEKCTRLYLKSKEGQYIKCLKSWLFVDKIGVYNNDMINLYCKLQHKYYKIKKTFYKPYTKGKEDIYKNIYYLHVWIISESQPLYKLPLIEKRGAEFNLDHIIPISYGYKNNINPEKIGNIKNLQILSWEENKRKNYKVDKDNLQLIII